MKSEKITINLSPVELAQIDFLVEKGLYASRSDFIRLATRKQTDEHKKEIERFVDPSMPENSWEGSEVPIDTIFVLGIALVDKDQIEELFFRDRKLDIRVIGVLKISDNVDPQKFKHVLKRAKISGKINAKPEIKTIIEAFNKK